MQTHQCAHGEVPTPHERVQPPRVEAFHPQNAWFREAGNAHNPPGSSEEESEIRRLQEEKEPQVDDDDDDEWVDDYEWDVEETDDFDADELGIDPEGEEESDVERDRRYN